MSTAILFGLTTGHQTHVRAFIAVSQPASGYYPDMNNFESDRLERKAINPHVSMRHLPGALRALTRWHV